MSQEVLSLEPVGLGNSNLEDKKFMLELFQQGAIGTKEFRSWLAKVDSVFNEIRDADVDNEIDATAREREAARDSILNQLTDNPGNSPNQG